MVARVWRSPVPRHPWIQPTNSTHPGGGARTHSNIWRRAGALGYSEEAEGGVTPLDFQLSRILARTSPYFPRNE
jgi:hypothetical protein